MEIVLLTISHVFVLSEIANLHELDRKCDWVQSDNECVFIGELLPLKYNVDGL